MKCSMNQTPVIINDEKLDTDNLLCSISKAEKFNEAKINKIIDKMVNFTEDYLRRIEQQNEEKITQLISRNVAESNFYVLMASDAYQESVVAKK